MRTVPGLVRWGVCMCKMSSVIIWAASPTRWPSSTCVWARVVHMRGNMLFRLLVRTVQMTCCSNTRAELWNAPGTRGEREWEREDGRVEGEQAEKDFNPATCLQCLDLERCCRTPSQFSPCVGDTRSGPFTFPLCAKLSWFLAMNRICARTHPAAVTHTNCPRLPAHLLEAVLWDWK